VVKSRETAYGRPLYEAVSALTGQGELQRGTMGTLPWPTAAIVGFHDRTADRESHTHAAGFGGEEALNTVLISAEIPDAANPST